MAKRGRKMIMEGNECKECGTKATIPNSMRFHKFGCPKAIREFKQKYGVDLMRYENEC